MSQRELWITQASLWRKFRGEPLKENTYSCVTLSAPPASFALIFPKAIEHVEGSPIGFSTFDHLSLQRGWHNVFLSYRERVKETDRARDIESKTETETDRHLLGVWLSNSPSPLLLPPAEEPWSSIFALLGNTAELTPTGVQESRMDQHVWKKESYSPMDQEP
jgi:hypothetical protein